MIKKLLLVLVAMFVSVAAYADSWTDSIPETYQAKDCQMVASASSACNQGAEPFSKFLRRFNMSSSYRESRVLVTDNTSEYSKNIQVLITRVNLLKDTNILPLRDVNSKSRLATWFNVSADMVCYLNRIGCLICFERVEGKWYVTDVELAS